MAKVKLKDVAIVKAGNAAPAKNEFTETGKPFVRAGSLAGLLEGGKLSDLELLDDEAAKRLGIRLFPAGTVLFAKSGMSCLKGYVYTLPEDCYVVSHLACVTPKEGYAKYLEHYFRYNKPNRLIENPSFPSIKLSKISEIEIDLPSENGAQEVVDKLEFVNAQIEVANATIVTLNELVKSRFVEMFGDPETNPCGWEVSAMGDLATDVRYGTSKPAGTEGEYTYIRMNNMTYEGDLDLSDTKRITLEGKELEKCLVQKGDLLFNRTNSREHVGKTCVFQEDEPMVIAGYIIRVRLKDAVLPEYVSAFLNSKYAKRLLKEMAHGAVNQANINAKEMQSIELMVPPIDLQMEYLAFIQQVDKLEFAARQQIEKLQELYDSLAQEYFGGQEA